MMKEYQFFMKSDNGFRGSIIPNATSFSVTFRMNSVSKWTMEGAGLTPCPFVEGSEIIVYRGEEPFFSGFVQEIEDNFDSSTNIYDWSVTGEDDFGKLAHRVIFPDATKSEPDPDDKDFTGYLSDVLLGIVRENAVAGYCLNERIIPRFDVLTLPHIGEELTLNTSFDEILSYILDKIQDNTLGIRAVWNGETGRSDLQIFQPHDVSNTVIFSVESGSVASWTRTKKAPKANWIYCQGCEYVNKESTADGTDLHVIVSDAASIAKWGRIEMFLDKSDIKPIEEKDDDGEVISTESWDSVMERLEKAATDALIENSAQNGFKLTIAELDRMEYKKHWDIGDTVAVRVGGEEFTAPIEEIKITYSGGIETITPSIGEIQRGELQTLFEELGSLKNRITVLQNSEAIRSAKKVKKALRKWAVQYEEEEESEDTSTPTTIPQCANRINMLGRHLRELRERSMLN